MKRNFKKAISIILAAVILLCSAPLSGLVGLELPDLGTLFAPKAEAAETYASGYYYSVDENGNAIITGIDDYEIKGDISIPSTLDGYPVTKIGEKAFGYVNGITSVVIPEGVIIIDIDAFLECDDLQNVSLPASLIEIESSAFYRTNLTEITIPDSVTTIDAHAFGKTNLKNVKIGSGTTDIGKMAFEFCKIEKFVVDNLNSSYSSDENGVLFNKNKSVLMCYPSNNVRTEYSIPESVKIIDDYAFSGCNNLESIIIPESVTNIGDWAFGECGNLKYINIPPNITSIGDGVFAYCESLASITIPDSITSIGVAAFSDCTSITSITIPNSVTKIEERAFYSCANLENLTLPDSISSIGEQAFNLTAYYNDDTNWENGVLYIDNHLIEAEVSGEYTVRNGTKTISDDAFWDSGSTLTKITIPDSVVYIGKDSLSYSGIEEIIIPNSVTNIGEEAFYNCSNLADITFSSNITNIGNDAFYGTAYYNDENNWEKGALYIGNCMIETNDEIAAEYIIKDGTKTIADKTFYQQYKITKIEIPNSVTHIGNYAFTYCSNITNLVVGEGIEYIGDFAFLGCGLLTDITIPDGVKSVGKCAFARCGDVGYILNGNVSNMKTGENLTEIKTETFAFCYGLYEIVLCNNTVKIDDGAFRFCVNLENIIIPDTLEIIGYAAFNGCQNLKDIYYTGTEEEWKEITIEAFNRELTNATIHYNYNPCTHSYTSTITTPATCMENGVMTYTCSECGDVYTESIPALGHNAGEWEVVTNSTCTAVGEKVKKCTVCGEILETEEIAVAEHISGSWVISIEPSCTEEGEKVAHCTECGVIVANDVVPATGHTAGEIVTITPATCTENGEGTGSCTVCGEILETVEIPATGHNAGTWETTLEPTTETEGKKIKKCTVCGETLEEGIITKLPKEPVKDNTVVSSPSTSTINYGDAIVLHVDESKIPEGGYVVWSASNNNFSYTADGATCEITPEKSGDTTFTAIIYDADGNPVSTDEQTMTSKAGFFQKIIAFFKGIFGLNKTYPSVFKIK